MSLNTRKLPQTLFFMRMSIFLVMMVWTIDKFIRPEHAITVYKNFYFLGGITTHVMYALGGIELLLLCGFLFGVRKRLTYGFVLIVHAISTFSSFKQYLTPFEGPNLLFFAAWPMLAACYSLYVLRDRDTFFALN